MLFLPLIVASVSALEVRLPTFEEFVSAHGRMYADEEVEMRRDVYYSSIRAIKRQNEAYEAGKSSWFAAVNEFADKTQDEMKRMRGYDRIGAARRREAELASGYAKYRTADASSDPLPTSVDWRKKNVVTAVKNQGGCGSCWAFSTTESVESAVAIATGKLLTLAPQTYVSCMANPNQCGGTGGCQGATPELGFDYTVKNGVALESDYPYTASDSSCKKFQAAAFVDGKVVLENNNATALMQAVANDGPVSIAAAAQSWSFYGGGIFDGMGGNGCDVDVDHAIQLVGYGNDGNKAYWLVRNSWGAGWGEEGYIRILRSPGNEPCAMDKTPLDGVCGKSGDCKCPAQVKYCGTCAILSDSTYPTGGRLP